MSTGLVRHPRCRTVDRAILGSRDDVMARCDVDHVGVSKKIVAGRRTPQTCVTFYVREKRAVPRSRRLPPFIDLGYRRGAEAALVATDVCAIGEGARAVAIRGGHRLFASDAEAGTVGLVLRTGARDLVLTNAHVVTDPGQLPGPVAIEAGGSLIGGVVLRMDDLNAADLRSDAALVEVPAGTVSPGMFHGVPIQLAAYADAGFNDPRRFFFVSMGFIHELRWGAWVDTPAPILVDGVSKTCSGFHKFDLTVGQMRPGNSGSVVFYQSPAGLIAVGLVFGAVLERNEAWVFPIRRCLAQVGIPA